MNSDLTRDVLVVGAGPVGLLTALLAARAGLDVEVIDREWRINARSYACCLHARSLDLLDELGILGSALESGVVVDTVAFYEGAERRAEFRLDRAEARHPFALMMYQDDLEGLLEDALQDEHGVRVHWGHRLDGISMEGDHVTILIDRLQHSPTGDPHHPWEEVVESRRVASARLVVGADGARSRMAHLLGAGSESAGEPTAFAIYEFEPLTDAGQELRIALHQGTINALWPLPGGTCRWCMELPRLPDAPGEQTEAAPLLDAPIGSDGRRRLLERIQQVAPWFTAGVHHVDWAMRLDFPRRMAHRFGRGACWLLGDAAHQTLPAGSQSMNNAFIEATEWVDAARRVLRAGAPPDQFQALSARWRRQWLGLTGIVAAVHASDATPAWVRANRDRLVSCVPASGTNMARMLAQLGLEWNPDAR